MTSNDAAVYYAITQARTEAGQYVSGDYVNMVINSLRSLREHSPRARVYCFLFGSFSTAEMQELTDLEAIVVQKPAVDASQRYVIKFLPLDEIPESTVVFLDADTYLFAPIESIWTKHTESDFYAKVEWGCDRQGPNHDPGECNWPLFDELADQLDLPGAKRLPLYNSGVMLFNRNFHRRLLDAVPLLTSLRDRFARGDLPYPHFYNRHVVGEVATLLALGAFADVRFGVLTPGACTFWREHKLEQGRDWGVICHTFAQHYGEFLEKLPNALECRGVRVSFG